MMPVIDGVMLAVSNSLAASIVAKVTVTTALGLIAASLARGNRAAVRHALLAAMFGAVLLLPIVSVVMPPLHFGVPVRMESQTALLQLGTGVDAKPSITTAGAGTRLTPVTPQVSKLSLSNLLLAGWAVGAALFLLPVVIGLWQFVCCAEPACPGDADSRSSKRSLSMLALIGASKYCSTKGCRDR